MGMVTPSRPGLGRDGVCVGVAAAGRGDVSGFIDALISLIYAGWLPHDAGFGPGACHLLTGVDGR